MNDVPQNHLPSIQLRVRKSYMIFLVVCAVVFAVVGVLSAAAAAWNIDGSFPRPVPMAVSYGVFWGALFLLSLYMAAATYRSKLIVTPESITQESFFRNRTISVLNIASATWRICPIGGSIVVVSRHSRITIDFVIFIADEREELILRLRELIPEGCQDNWDAFASLQQRSPLHYSKSLSGGTLSSTADERGECS